MEFWRNEITHPIGYSLFKKQNLINMDFDSHKGIIQKVVINNNVLGYFIACKIEKDNLIKIKNSFNTNLIIATFIPKDRYYTHTHIKLYAKSMIYNLGLRTIKKLVKNNINFVNFSSCFEKINDDLSRLFFINQDNDYINNIVNQAKEFDNRLARYYKNEKVLII